MFKKRTEEIMRLARNEDLPLCELTEMWKQVDEVDNISTSLNQELDATVRLELCSTTHNQRDTELVLCPLTGEFLNLNNESVRNIEMSNGGEDIVIDRSDVELVLCPTTGEFVTSDMQSAVGNVEVETISEDDDEVSVTKKIKIHQKRRALGKSYLGSERINGRYKQCSVKGQKKMKERCNHHAPKKITPQSLSCFAVSESDRSSTFKKFWSLTKWAEKKAYIHGLTIIRPMKKRRSSTTLESVRKTKGHDFYLATQDGKKHKVCVKMFINTIAISHSMLNRWCTSERVETDSTLTTKDKKRTNIGKENRNNVKTWLNLVPKVPSHYCRSNTSRVYVDNTFLSKTHMHSVYNAWCDESNLPKVGRNVFSEVLKRENISIHQPRKDQCDVCIAFQHGNIEKQLYDEHIKRKDRAREAKHNAKNSASDTTLVLTMDLQSVLLCPKLMASAVYYRQKLQVHNFTIYVLNNADVTLYTWHEADGGVTANEFTSCIVDYLQKIPPSYTNVVLISDGCNYQNRNKILASALSDLAKIKKIRIEQIILEKGHTMMEADNVHSVLEHFFKPPIYSPTDYVARMKMARPKHPYEIRNVHFDFFLNYEAMPSNLSSLRPGKKIGDPTVTDLRALQYLESGEINFKIDCSLDWLQLPQRRKSFLYSPPQKLYTASIPLSEAKFKHLMELKPYIDKDHHPFYDNLKFK